MSADEDESIQPKPGQPEVPRRLERADKREEFTSDAAELDEWLRRYAYQNQRANNAVTFVSTVDGVVIGYYAIAVGAIARDAVSAALAKNSPTQIPVILLARLAVDSAYKGQGIGVALFLDALKRALMLSESVGAKAVLIHARDHEAKRFYEYHSDCLVSPVDELQLLIPMQHIREALGG